MKGWIILNTLNIPKSVPRPLVRTNQWVIVLSVVISWFSGYEIILLFPLLSGVLGLLFDFNPVMRIAKLFLRKPMQQYIPEDKEQQKFNQMIATICLCGALLCSFVQWEIGYYIFTILVGTAATVALYGFCIGCFIHFQWNQYQYRRRKLKEENSL